MYGRGDCVDMFADLAFIAVVFAEEGTFERNIVAGR